MSSKLTRPLCARRFEYDILPGLDWIRLLRLDAGPQLDPISCELIQIKLNHAPPYKALSYVWGDVTDTGFIQCNHTIKSVTRSLWEALHRVRQSDKEMFVWADAICINQEDKLEQAQQVALMADIYEQAEHVLIWVGNDESGNAELAVDTIMAINARADEAYLNRDPEDGEEFDPGIPEDSPLLSEVRWQAIASLFDRPWFSRVWVMQEVGLAADATVYYGQTSIPWSEIIIFIVLIDKQIDLNSAAPLDLPIGPVLETFYAVWLSYDNPRSWRNNLRHVARPSPEFTTSHFLNVLLAGSAMGATDPRDRIYAFLGHPTAKIGRENETIVEPDYLISKEKLYLDLTVHLLEESGSLLSLSAVRHSEQSVANGLTVIPSWVERWDDQSDIVPLGVPVGNLQPFYDSDLQLDTSGLAKFEVAAMQSDGPDFKAHLTVKAIFVDEVLHCAPEMDREWLDIDGTTNADGEFSNLVEYLLSFLHNRGVELNENSMALFSQTLCVGLLDFDTPTTDDLEQHQADFYTFLQERCQHECGHPYYDKIAEHASALEAEGNAQNYATAAGRYCHGRKFFLTKSGMFGLGPPGADQDDKCAVLLGSRVPFLLRANNEGPDSTYSLLGEAYMHGMMRGEAVKLWKNGVLDLQPASIK